MPDFNARMRALIRPDRQPLRAEVPTRRGDDTTAIIRLYDPIDSWGEWWGVSAKEFASVLDDLPDTVTEIRLLINSPGGEVFDGIAILNLLRGHKARVVAVVEGIAASCASFIACGVDEIIMALNSELMIHDAWGVCIGNAQDMRDLAEDLDRLSDNIASVYAAKAGGDLADWRAVMARETWYTAEEAVTAGLADRIDSKAEPAEDAKARFDLSVFNFAGRRAAPDPTSAPPPSPSPDPGQRGGSVMDLTELRDALGIAEDTSDDNVVAWLTVVAQTPEPEPEPEPRPEPQPTVPEGHVVVPEARLRDLEAGAQAGAEVAERLRVQDRATFLDSVRAKYAPTNRAAWEAEYDRDPDGTRKHFETAPVILPLDQLGHGGAADLDTEFAEYNALYGKEAKV